MVATGRRSPSEFRPPPDIIPLSDPSCTPSAVDSPVRRFSNDDSRTFHKPLTIKEGYGSIAIHDRIQLLIEEGKVKNLVEPLKRFYVYQDASTSSNLASKENKSVGNNEVDFSIPDGSSNVFVKFVPQFSDNADHMIDDISNQRESFINAWRKPYHIKIDFDINSTEMSSDGVAVKLNPELELANSQILNNSVVLKVLGKNIPFSVCSTELRRQWNRFGKFHQTSLGLNWIICSFKSPEAMEEVLSDGPWYVGGHIVGMDKWSPLFSPLSLKGLSAPVLIHFPLLPLYCWDEVNIAKIASRIGTPMYLDGNSFKW